MATVSIKGLNPEILWKGFSLALLLTTMQKVALRKSDKVSYQRTKSTRV